VYEEPLYKRLNSSSYLSRMNRSCSLCLKEKQYIQSSHPV
jgi:hypothetical protein